MFGKYRIVRRIAEGGFAVVYEARDTIEGYKVALKIPHRMDEDTRETFERELKLAARLNHPNILPIKNADRYDGRLFLATLLGKESLEDRLKRRIATATALDLGQQALAAVAHAHAHKVIHCDLKPENMLLFPDGELKLADFGVARVALRTVRGSGTGTLGYCAPEQAMGKPSFHSDVFALGLVLCRLFSNQLPEWPFEWPPPGIERLRAKLDPEMIALIRRALEVDPRKRYRDAGRMETEYRRIHNAMKRRQGGGSGRKPRASPTSELAPWQKLKRREFRERIGKALDTRYRCGSCQGPVSEPMKACPWCGKSRKVHKDGTRFPARCPRCSRGVKADWRYCAWCYGPGFEPATTRQYPDKAYSARCPAKGCSRKDLMPFMKYCPWCRTKVRRRWRVPRGHGSCSGCGWGIAADFWSYCPWCTRKVEK